MLIRMFARERSQIICIFCHNLLALLLQMFAEFYLRYKLHSETPR